MLVWIIHENYKLKNLLLLMYYLLQSIKYDVGNTTIIQELITSVVYLTVC